MPEPRVRSHPPLAVSFPVAGASVGSALLTVLVVFRTLELNPHLDLSPRELAAWIVQLSCLYVPPALLAGGLVEALLRRWGAERLGGAMAGLFGIAPLAWWIVTLPLQPTARFVADSQETSATSTTETPSATDPVSSVAPRDPEPLPVVLLVIDGADPTLLRQLVDAGELPTFTRLLAEGTSGPLFTLLPTRSPILWTTLATGQPESVHGIHDFTRFRLPGVRAPLNVLAPGSGLQHLVFPRLEAMPWTGWYRVPYTSEARRAAALWEIVGEHWQVLVYRWLVTWPAEPVHGTMVAGGLWAGPGGWHPDNRRWVERMEEDDESPLDLHWTYPADLVDVLPAPQRTVQDANIAPYLRPDATLDRGSPESRFVGRSLRDPALEQLTALLDRAVIEGEPPRLLAAAFYSVDAFGHRFVDQHRDGGPYAPALVERYRHTDRQLGRWLQTVDQRLGEVQLLIVSDHGWDFEAGHHDDAPPGLFLAHGPAFAADRWVPTASLLHIAPLVLHLLGLPVATSMPGAHDFDHLLAADHLPAPRWVADYPRRALDTTATPPLDARRRDELRSLGYLP